MSFFASKMSYLWPSFKTELYYGNFHHTSGVTHAKSASKIVCSTSVCYKHTPSPIFRVVDVVVIHIRLFFSVYANVCSYHKSPAVAWSSLNNASSKFVDAAVQPSPKQCGDSGANELKKLNTILYSIRSLDLFVKKNKLIEFGIEEQGCVSWSIFFTD